MCWSSWYQSTASWMTPWGQRRGYTKISLTFIRVTGREIPRRSCDALDSCKAFFFVLSFLFSKTPFCSGLFDFAAAQRRSRPSTWSWIQFRHSADSWRRSCLGPVTRPCYWTGQLKSSLTLEVGTGRVQPPRLQAPLSPDALCDHSTTQWHSKCEMELSPTTDGQVYETLRSWSKRKRSIF